MYDDLAGKKSKHTHLYEPMVEYLNAAIEPCLLAYVLDEKDVPTMAREKEEAERKHRHDMSVLRHNWLVRREAGTTWSRIE